MKEDIYNSFDRSSAIIPQQEQEPHSHKPFMAKVPIKQTPIGYELYQINVPQFDSSKALKPSNQRKIIWEDVEINSSRPVFLTSQTKQENILKYLTYIETYFEQKIPDYFSQDISIHWKTQVTVH